MVLDLKGSLPVLITPFTQKNTVDINGICTNVERMLTHGVQGLVVPGGTGETAHLTPLEFQQVVQSVVDIVNGRVPVIASPIFVQPKVVVEQAQAAENEAQNQYFRLLPLFWYLTAAGPRIIPIIKAGVTITGGVGGLPRPPFLPATNEEIDQLTKVLQKIKKSNPRE